MSGSLCGYNSVPSRNEVQFENNISYSNLDFTSPEALVESIRSIGTSIVIDQLNSEPILDENKSSGEIHSLDLDEYVGKIVSVTLDPTGDLNRIEL